MDSSVDGGSASVAVTTPRLKRTLSAVGIVLADLVSAWLSLIPLSILMLAVLQAKADLVGPDRRVLDADEPMVEVLLIGSLLLLAALLPALVVNILLGRASGWRCRTRSCLGVIVVLTPYMVSFLWNDVWNFFVRYLLP